MIDIGPTYWYNAYYAGSTLVRLLIFRQFLSEDKDNYILRVSCPEFKKPQYLISRITKGLLALTYVQQEKTIQ